MGEAIRRPGRKAVRRRLLPLVVGAAIGVAGMAVRAGAAELPAAPPPGGAAAGPMRLPGKMVFAALVTPDLIRAETFYTDLFRWQFRNARVDGRLIGQASYNGRTVAAVVERPTKPGERPVWRSFLSTADVDGSVALAVQHGATVLVKPHQLAGIGSDALLADPQGAVFGLLASAGSDPADVPAMPGEWIWSTLVAPDPAADAGFYTAVFGYETHDAAEAGDPGHVVLASAGFARASVNPIPTDHPVSHPRWISYVRVDDMAAMVARATALGATVVVPMHPDRNGGTVALLADPAGALFGLLQWQDDPATDTDAGDAK